MDEISFATAWWKADNDELANVVSEQARLVYHDQMFRVQMLWDMLQSYQPSNYLTQSLYMARQTAQPSYNMIANQIDTYASWLATAKPLPMGLCQRGSTSQHLRARRATSWMQGAIKQAGFHQSQFNACVDAAACGTGILKVIEMDGQPDRLERVLPYEVLIPEGEATHRNPRQIFHVKAVAKSKLMEDYPEKAAEISSIPNWNWSFDNATRPVVQDTVMLVEAFCLPDKDGKNGIRALVAGNVVFGVDRKWKAKSLPFVFYWFQQPRIGMWGTGIVELVNGLQRWQNGMMRRSQAILEHHARPFVTVLQGCGVTESQISNSATNVYTTTTHDAIQTHVATSMPQDLPQFMQLVEQWAQRGSGVDPFMSQSELPGGLDKSSGKALQLVGQVSSKRFKGNAEHINENCILATELLIDAAERRAAKGKSSVVAVGDRGYARKIDWSEIRLDREEFVLDIYPVSSVASDPAGKAEQLNDMFAKGLIDGPTYKRMLQDLDPDSIEDVDSAMEECLGYQLEKMLVDGEPEAPLAEMKFDYVIPRVETEIYLATVNQVDEEKIQLLRDYNAQAARLRKKKVMEAAREQAELQAALQPPIPPGAPMGPPGAPPPVGPA